MPELSSSVFRQTVCAVLCRRSLRCTRAGSYSNTAVQTRCLPPTRPRAPRCAARRLRRNSRLRCGGCCRGRALLGTLSSRRWRAPCGTRPRRRCARRRRGYWGRSCWARCGCGAVSPCACGDVHLSQPRAACHWDCEALWRVRAALLTSRDGIPGAIPVAVAQRGGCLSGGAMCHLTGLSFSLSPKNKTSRGQEVASAST